MDNRWLGVIVLIIIVVLGGWYVFSHPTTPGPAAVMPTTDQATTTPDMGATLPVIVTYTDQGFSPASVEVVVGQSVMFVNQGSEQMWVASGPHPSHTGYDGTSRSAHCAADYTGTAPFDECAAALSDGSFTFTFDKAGTWKYHNHADQSMTGTVVVTVAPADASTTAAVNAQ